MEFYAQLGPGWNMGNTLDAHAAGFVSDLPEEHETLWGNPAASAELFGTVYDAGFRTVRIPVTWYPHMDDSSQVDETWMAHVQTRVDQALAAGLFVILNVHHDDWVLPCDEMLDDAERKLVLLWRQICDTFADYDERLLFEGMNEPRLVGHAEEWTAGTTAARQGVNRLNQAFVETVRGAAGQNRERYLLVPSYAAACHPEVLADFVLPNDEKLGVSVHLYLPNDFALEEKGTDHWSVNNAGDTAPIDQVFALLKERFVAQGIPVVLTEFGARDKDNTKAREAWTAFVTQNAREMGISYIWWDDGFLLGGVAPSVTFALLDRNKRIWIYPELVDILVA